MKMKIFSIIFLLYLILNVGVDCLSSRNSKRSDQQSETIVGSKESSKKEKHWGYRNEDKSILPSKWHEKHPSCYGKQQSPINIESHDTQYDSNLTQIHISSVYKEFLHGNTEIWSIKNNGHSVNKEITFRMQPENDQYKLLQMHFHWRGSEHFVEGHRFVAELHLVHQNVKDESKYAVLGFLFRQSNQENLGLKPIVDDLRNILTYGSKEVDTKAFRLDKLLPSKVTDYYRYSGSLTTPGCDEVVEWFIMDNPVLTISDEQILDFQSVEDNHGYPILSNSRPIQDINFRTVRRSFGASIKPLPKYRNLLSASGHTEKKESYNLCNHANSHNWHGALEKLIMLLMGGFLFILSN